MKLRSRVKTRHTAIKNFDKELAYQIREDAK